MSASALENVADRSATESSPFFILGCVRSGTTLLRNFLRLHPRLECPEETHLFRWADPFASFRYEQHYADQITLETHRKIDGIEDTAYFDVFNSVGSRRELADWYGNEFLRVRGNPQGRWFDKTPQNVYGILLISEAYPDAKFIHIYRNPLNVVASLKGGKVMPIQSLRAAISVWVESMMILNQFRRLAGERLLEFAYENLTAEPDKYVRKCLRFVGEDPEKIDYATVKAYRAMDNYKNKLTEEEITRVLDGTDPYRSRFGYG